MSQCEAVLDHLCREGSITPMEALRKHKIMRLAARVEELRSRGHRIETEIVRRGSRRWARYCYHSQTRAAPEGAAK
jgi:hypothetical protein